MATASQSELSEVHRTAFSAAALRAAHALRGAEPKIFDDDLAMQLIDMTEEEVVAIAARVPAASATTCVVRSRFTEDRLAAARARLDQYVVLGAGLDSYALRMGDRLGELVVFEVDDPPFQAWKQQRIEARGLTAPPQLRFVPCDFERTSIAEALAAGGFAEDRPCFISWLGVTQYLTRDAVKETLRWAGARPAGSEIVLTYLESGSGAEVRKASMASRGIADLQDYTLAEMTAMLREAGFTHVEHFPREAATDRYFQQRSDGLIAPEIQNLISATV
jgi:methyltransferase (TIGR00027 family)